MRTLFTGDWHIGITTHGIHDQQSGMNSRLVDIASVAQEIVDYAISNKVDAFVHLGDLFHRNDPSPTEEAIAVSIIKRLDDAGISSIFFDGNHDWVFGKRRSAISMLGECRWNSVGFISGRPKAFWLPDMVLLCAPHCDQQNIEDSVRSLSADNRLCVLACHTSFTGCVVGSEDRMLAPSVRMLPKLSGVDLVMSGHIHKPQHLKSAFGGSVDVIYPGSPMAFDFGERNDRKGFVLLTNSGKQFSYEFVELKKARKLVQIESADFSSWPDVSGAIVNVVVSVDQDQTVDQREIEDALISRGAFSIASVSIERKSKVKAAAFFSQIKPDSEMIDDYLSSRLSDPVMLEMARAAANEALSA